METKTYTVDGKQVKRARYFQIKRILNGKCPYCPNPLPIDAKGPCRQCTIARRLKRRLRKNQKPWQKGSRGRPPLFPDPVETQP
jgi:hypothetical protein